MVEGGHGVRRSWRMEFVAPEARSRGRGSQSHELKTRSAKNESPGVPQLTNIKNVFTAIY